MTGPRAALRTVLLLALCLGGCGGLFRSNAKPEQVYYLRPPGAAAAPPASSKGSDSAAGVTTAGVPSMPVSLRVGRPDAGPGLDATHIMLLQADHRMNFYSGSRWPAPLPELIEALAVQTLRASGEWASVEDSGSPFASDYLLQLHVRRFESDYTAGGDAPTVHVALDCTLGRRQGRDIVGTFSVAASAPASANRLGDVVAAFEQATGTALDSLARQSALAVQRDMQRMSENDGKPAASIR